MPASASRASAYADVLSSETVADGDDLNPNSPLDSMRISTEPAVGVYHKALINHDHQRSTRFDVHNVSDNIGLT